MKKNVYSLLVMVALALTATFTACSDDDDDTPLVEIELDENIVTDVFSKGYQLGDRVLRHAMVKVAN